jgi:hypothetical protein
VPPRLDVHIIMDNYGTHKTPLIRNWFAKRPRSYGRFGSPPPTQQLFRGAATVAGAGD